MSTNLALDDRTISISYVEKKACVLSWMKSISQLSAAKRLISVPYEYKGYRREKHEHIHPHTTADIMSFHRNQRIGSGFIGLLLLVVIETNAKSSSTVDYTQFTIDFNRTIDNGPSLAAVVSKRDVGNFYELSLVVTDHAIRGVFRSDLPQICRQPWTHRGK